jgi:hypothetical protein
MQFGKEDVSGSVQAARFGNTITFIARGKYILLEVRYV